MKNPFPEETREFFRRSKKIFSRRGRGGGPKS